MVCINYSLPLVLRVYFCLHIRGRFLEVFVIGGKVVAITLISLIAPIDEGLTQAIASYIARIKRLLFILHVLAISIFL